MVRDWYEKTPVGLVFAAKGPQVTTRERVLVDCQGEMTQFLKTVDRLGEELGLLLFQFGYLKRSFAAWANFWDGGKEKLVDAGRPIDAPARD